MTKTILITGSTDGIGKLAALKLAEAGHQVYVHGRNADKLTSVIAEVKAVATGAAVDNIGGFVADFSDLNAVRKMAAEVNEKLPKLDVLINNAGINTTASVMTKDGLDVRFVVNYLAPRELTNALLPLLKKSSEARIVNLSSAAQDPISYKAFVGQERLDDKDAYAQSKLALTMWSMDLADTVAADDINVIAVNPGSLLNTKMVDEAYGEYWASADKGANILTELAISDEFANDSGKYFDNDIKDGAHGDARGEFGQPHADALDKEAITELERQTQTVLQSLSA
ncbi:NAD(P)-dependent dehydrogenase (short-subunit alcohol dehydrogenase family) [Psychrobacter luti]|uniref:NAD(P)-dependent dehydrogenase (Short-subunit alcohol dehydrogenase family) n=1 Tax=Psychrobacter luti TaxID=198481 RepID=A0A839TD96_9GAMM|nr:SDR family NAD(P)-dependent oxidoreductase [Psychrobacter luti]MBB3107148.1 NAD(P)-dependent dehydrogenase (short-subunit alcohol dehydrogenase family) [Psychrobacter luti]